MYMLLLAIVGFITVVYVVQQSLQLTDKMDINKQFELLSADLKRTKVEQMSELTSLQEKDADTETGLSVQLADIFPQNESYTELTRQLDDFFKKNNTSANPLIASDLRFGSPILDETKQYNILPFSMSITASESNFYTFLNYVQNSGALSGDKVRLMNIQSININFRKGEKSSSQEVSFHVEMNAFFQ